MNRKTVVIKINNTAYIAYPTDVLINMENVQDTLPTVVLINDYLNADEVKF